MNHPDHAGEFWYAEDEGPAATEVFLPILVPVFLAHVQGRLRGTGFTACWEGVIEAGRLGKKRKLGSRRRGGSHETCLYGP